MKILWIYICIYIYESLARAIKILLQLFKANPNENARIYLEYRCIGKYCHPACCATFTVPRIFRWIPWNLSSRFLSFLFFSFRIAHGGKLSKGCIHPMLRFPVDKPSRNRIDISSPWRNPDTLGRCVCQSKHFRNFIRCAFNYPWSWSWSCVCVFRGWKAPNGILIRERKI